MTQMFNNVGPDNNLDVVVSLVTFGSYPNVCYHKEKRKILTTEGRNALIHKSSVNCPFSSQDLTYPSPFFVFSEKVPTHRICFQRVLYCGTGTVSVCCWLMLICWTFRLQTNK